jgi:hypothetical protein
VPKKYVVLEIDESRAQELLDALLKRSFLKIHSVPLGRAERKALETCPACLRKLGRESVITVNDEVIDGLMNVLSMMKRGIKSVVISWRPEAIQDLSIHEQKRAVVVHQDILKKCVLLGLMEPFMDGRQLTHFVTAKALRFLESEEPLTPSRIIYGDGYELTREGTLWFKDVKYKNQIQKDMDMREAKRLVRGLPDRVREFVEKGQIPLI